MRGSLVHALTIDVEDYFQVLNARDAVDRASWATTPLRCGDATRRILETLGTGNAAELAT